MPLRFLRKVIRQQRPVHLPNRSVNALFALLAPRIILLILLRPQLLLLLKFLPVFLLLKTGPGFRCNIGVGGRRCRCVFRGRWLFIGLALALLLDLGRETRCGVGLFLRHLWDCYVRLRLRWIWRTASVFGERQLFMLSQQVLSISSCQPETVCCFRGASSNALPSSFCNPSSIYNYCCLINCYLICRP